MLNGKDRTINKTRPLPLTGAPSESSHAVRGGKGLEGQGKIPTRDLTQM